MVMMATAAHGGGGGRPYLYAEAGQANVAADIKIKMGNMEFGRCI